LILRHPNVFSAAAAWDAPAQFTDMSAFPGMAENFGTEQNFDRYEIPTLVIKNGEALRSRNRVWISGDESAWTLHMIQLHDQLVQAEIPHTWVQSGPRIHSWYSGWLEGAVAALNANASAEAPVDVNAQRIVAYGLRNPTRFAFRPGTGEIWTGDTGLNQWEEINRIANTPTVSSRTSGRHATQARRRPITRVSACAPSCTPSRPPRPRPSTRTSTTNWLSRASPVLPVEDRSLASPSTRRAPIRRAIRVHFSSLTTRAIAFG
jgi:hypothetical protein